MADFEPRIKGPDGREYTISEWESQHIAGVFEQTLPGGRVLRGARCSCGWTTAAISTDAFVAQRMADEHIEVQRLMDEI